MTSSPAPAPQPPPGPATRPASESSTRAWRVGLLALCLCCAGLRLWSLAYLERNLVPGAAGGMGARLCCAEGPRWMREVKHLRPESDLARQGVKVGDRLSFDRAGDAWRPMGVGELIPVTVESLGQTRRLQVRTLPVPGRITPIHQVAALGNLLDGLMALGVAVLMSLRRPDSPAVRALAAALALYSVSDVGALLPGGLVQTVIFLTGSSLQFFLTTTGYFFFAIAYPDTHSHFAKPWVRRVFFSIAGVGLLLALFEAAFFLRLLPISAKDWQFTIERLASAPVNLASVVAVAFLWASWRHAVGTARLRAAWIGAFVAMLLLSTLVFGIVSALPGRTLQRELIVTCVQIVLDISAMLGLAYAVLRHRVFGFGFASNRLAVWLLSALGMAAVIAAVQAVLARLPALPGHPAGPGRPDRPDHGAGGRVCAAAQAGRAHRAGQLVSRLACP